mmetsp:Transcript_15720/g.51573  ORF Transcript_15720/g.51573 Transcript_15720/m.51573 type:complete len:706 (-) Transcript_15720:126-2243(-)
MGKGGNDMTVSAEGAAGTPGLYILPHGKSTKQELRKLRRERRKVQSPRERLRSVKEDLSVLKAMWLNKLTGSDHESRLEHFYGPQALAYDKFRTNFLWGRERLLRDSAARLAEQRTGSNKNLVGTADAPLIWVDVGGGTAENVKEMAKYMNLSDFHKVYVVDLCKTLCDVAQKKKEELGWGNVEIVHADACSFQLPEGQEASLVTFSYSLSMIPEFHEAVDNAISLLAPNGFLGVADFFVSSKYDLPLRQMGSIRRCFWKTVFDMDNIDVGPERRNYLDHKLVRVSEYNGKGPIPYVPLLRAPYYVWIGANPMTPTDENGNEIEAKRETPPLFPPTFLYSLSWEDPRADEPVLKTGKGDVVLTLTSGACNALDLMLQGADATYSVDMNPAQSYLLELKMEAIRRLPYEDVWQLFGEGKHPDIQKVFHRYLGPFLTERCQDFWGKRLHYFQDGLYYFGSMGLVIWASAVFVRIMGMGAWLKSFTEAKTIEEQRKAWFSCWVVRLLMMLPSSFNTLLGAITMNNGVMWGCLGVPPRQASLIRKDGRTVGEYAATVFNGVSTDSLLVSENYFYLCCLTGKFTRQCCPQFLKEDQFKRLQESDMLDRLHNVTGSFLDELAKREYSKVILMDHVDWVDPQGEYLADLCEALGRNVRKGGIVIFRSASLNPPYVDAIAAAGFEVKCEARHFDKPCIDLVNMYASFWSATKL